MVEPIPLWEDLTVKQKMNKELKWNIIAETVNEALESLGAFNDIPKTAEETYDLHIDVSDGENPITGASVVIDETSRKTGGSGGCNFTGLSKGEKIVNVTKEGFIEKVEVLDISSDASVTIVLNPSE